jgi:hypothetical protein
MCTAVGEVAAEARGRDCLLHWNTLSYMNSVRDQLVVISVVAKVGGTASWGAVGLPRWALIGTRGGRGR